VFEYHKTRRARGDRESTRRNFRLNNLARPTGIRLPRALAHALTLSDGYLGIHGFR
jgi:hypothetical protein